MHDAMKVREECKFCGKTYSQNSHLQHHIRSVHEGIKANKCELCDKEFVRKESLTYHTCLTS